MTMLSRGTFTSALAGLSAATIWPRGAGAQAMIAVRGAITQVYYDAVPLLYAQHSGMFAKAGIDLDLGRLPTGSAVTTAVAGGSLNIGESTFFAVVAAFSRGVPITVIAPGVIYDSRSPNGALLVTKHSPIHGVADMSGKVIAVNNLSEPTRPATELWLRRVASVVEASAAYTNAHHVELSGQIAGLVGASATSIAHMAWPASGTSLVASEMQPVIDLSLKSGFIEKGFEARDMIFDAKG